MFNYQAEKTNVCEKVDTRVGEEEGLNWRGKSSFMNFVAQWNQTFEEIKWQ